MKHIFSIILILMCSEVRGQDYNKIDFSVAVGDCFVNDTISFTINEFNLFNSVIVTSDPSTGITSLSIYQDSNFLVVNYLNKKFFKKIDVSKPIKFSISVNHRINNSFIVNLKKGKLLIIDFCKKNNKTNQNVKSITIHQFKKPVKLE